MSAFGAGWEGASERGGKRAREKGRGGKPGWLGRDPGKLGEKDLPGKKGRSEMGGRIPKAHEEAGSKGSGR